MSSASDAEDRPVIDRLDPPAAIAGGSFELRGSNLSAPTEQQPVVRFGKAAGRLIVGGSHRVVVSVPEDAAEGSITVQRNGQRSEAAHCSLGLAIAENLHPVANPAVDAEGNIYTTRSGSRGEKVPVSVFKIDLNFNLRPLVSEIINPTGLLVDPDGSLLVSGRHDGTIYSVDPNGQVEAYAEGMGVATGLAMDAAENLYVGDRTGTIFKIARDRQIFVFATLEPSISAYHLAFGPDGNLYVSGPTTSSYDPIYRVLPTGDVEVFRRGFGRPQGLTFDAAGRMYAACSYRGRKGVFRMSLDGDGEPELVVSGPGIVGQVLTKNGEMIVATASSLYRVPGAGWLD
ncbi:MAG: gluconolaconase [Acidobacteria bacterium]|nr:gluconolaconase [Acidobacteriota bacterium]